ncbi:AAA family ATPase [Gallaecimonas kandeliae]|uniref:AAA family ATPase n=1 Tax=Gallaecimonas kandeliae TaxID=3029055 RepID=UPI00264882C1|nr:AAA family ATPase [Gallaecimonas kandeliae]WKE64364.1 AAA family ATPase [Gallaecimonas kandeliae]
MKEAIAPVKNVIATQDVFDSLAGRSYGVPGIGLIHGSTGLGKTTAVTHLFNQVNGIYVVARATDSATSLLSRIMDELGADPMPRVSRMVDHIIEQMSMHERSLFIDEADHLMRDVRMLETVRDIYDATEVPVVLIGMDQIARRISSRKQFYNRISEWAEFRPADLEDVMIMAETLLEDGIQVDPDLLDQLRKSAGGEMRRLAIGLGRIEKLAKTNELDFVTCAHWGDQPFFGSSYRPGM